MSETKNELSEIFGFAMDASVDGIVITDNRQPDNPIVYCNSSFELLTGYNRDEIIGHNCRFLQAEDRSQEKRMVIREAIQKGEACQVDIRNYRKDGSFFWNELSISPVRNDNGDVTHFIGIQNDISRRKKAEADLIREQENLENRVSERTNELEESEAYLAGVVETIRESLLILDDELLVLSVNKHFEKSFKISEEELVGKELPKVLDGAWNIDGLIHLLKDVLPTHNPFEDFEVEHTFPFIGKRRLLLNAAQVTLKGKYQDRILLAMEDITERHRIEKQKEDFIGIASHEMKTPLTVIKGQLQLLQRSFRQEKNSKHADRIDQALSSLDKLNGLIANLLDVSQLQNGKIRFDETEFILSKLMDTAVEQTRAIADSHQIEVSGAVDTLIKGDFSRLSQVLVNLLLNAMKYSPDSARVEIHVGKVSDYIKVAITDRGVGISKENHQRIFERFFRVDDDEQVFQGAGIGLFICKQIIEAHQGTLWVESELNEGATFSFTLPVK